MGMSLHIITLFYIYLLHLVMCDSTSLKRLVKGLSTDPVHASVCLSDLLYICNFKLSDDLFCLYNLFEKYYH